MRNLPTSNDLIRCVRVFSSHDDFSVFEAVYAGYDDQFNLLVMCEHTDYDDPDYCSATYAILNKHEAVRLAIKLKVSLPELPSEIAGSVSEWNETDFPRPSDVRDCFKEITDNLLSMGCHFKIERKPSANGFTAC